MSDICLSKAVAKPRLGIKGMVHSLSNAWLTLMERREQRHLLLSMNDHQLHDIGLSRVDALNEGQKSIWRQ